jgi:WD40 repeat protein
MAEVALPLIRITVPHREFGDHKDNISAFKILPNGCQMVTASRDKTLHLWDLKDGVLLKKMKAQHRNWVEAVAVSGNGQFMASADEKGELIAWQGDGEPLTQVLKAHSGRIRSLDFSPDGAVLATGSWDGTMEFWSTKTWEVQGDPINCGEVNCVQFSPSGELLAIATHWDIQIWKPHARECIMEFKAHAAIKSAWNFAVTWTPDGTHILSAGSYADPTIRQWNTSTWQQVGDPWKGHTDWIYALAMNSTGTLVASASDDYHVRLWRLSDQRPIAIFKSSEPVWCVAFSADDKHIFSGCYTTISEWAVPEEIFLEDVLKRKVLEVSSHSFLRCRRLTLCRRMFQRNRSRAK